ncbi:MAG: hypothetical protein JSV12_03470 [Candidatus Bathyarchaeota archaeon]|nr:MAG: hypothetical protein JSV12_03470 [Candidatus Bathyarchaeota archaeon]
MYDYKKDIEMIKNPENIREAVYASSPCGLMIAFENDLIVQRLINAGQEVVPLITEELEKTGLELPEITLACFAYILQKLNLTSAAKTLKPLFVRAVEKPGPFFVHFAAHALRQATKLQTKPLGMTYTRTELLESLKPGKPKTMKGRERKKNA